MEEELPAGHLTWHGTTRYWYDDVRRAVSHSIYSLPLITSRSVRTTGF